MVADNSVYCFLDTQILLHFTTFDQADWRQLAPSVHVILVLAPIVLAELDQHKNDGSNDWRRKRARMLLSKLNAMLGTAPVGSAVTVGPGVSLLDIASEPQVDWAALGLDPAVNDDRLVASILVFRAQNPAHQVILLSDDFAARRKAQQQHIESRSPDGLLAEIERPSDEAAANLKLQRELNELKSRLPVLRFSFWEGQATTNETTRTNLPGGSPVLTMDAIAQQVADKRQKLVQIVANARGRVADAELQEFVSGYNEYIVRMEAASQFRRTKDHEREVRLDFILVNDGSALATNIELELRFPEHSFAYGFGDDEIVSMMADDEFPDEPIPEWTKVKNPFNPGSIIVPHFSPPPQPAPPPQPRGPLHISDRWDVVRYRSPRLRHKENWLMKPVGLYLPPETGNGFEIAYSLHADELMDRIEGRLVVKLAN